MAKSKTNQQTLLAFPCRFPIKVMGKKDAGLEDFVKKVLHNHVKDISTLEYKTRDSSDGNYVSITALFIADSKAQLDKIYHAISHNKNVKMVL